MSFTIHEETVPFLINGSDLMIPGIIVCKPLNEHSYGIFNENELVTVNTNKNRAPIAIGTTHMSSDKMALSAGKGKAVNVIHVQGDFLWQFGDKSLPPQIDWIVYNEKPEEISDLTEEMENLSIDNVLIDESIIIDMDKMLFDCFIHALKCSLKDRDLPIALNLFYANHVLRFCPDGFDFDIKRTKYKKFGIFMDLMANEERLIQLTELKKGIKTITGVDRAHEKMRFSPHLEFQTASKGCDDAAASKAPYVFPRVEDVLFITDKSWNILKFSDLSKSEAITPSRLREIVREHVARNELQSALNTDSVRLDDALRAACTKGGNKESVPLELKWKTLMERIHGNMTPGVAIEFPHGTVRHRNAKSPKIRLAAANKHNKVVTRVDGVAIFGIDEKQLCTAVQQAVGCSCGVVTDKSGVAAVQAQGDQRVRIDKILKEVYKVPARFIEAAGSVKGK